MSLETELKVFLLAVCGSCVVPDGSSQHPVPAVILATFLLS